MLQQENSVDWSIQLHRLASTKDRQIFIALFRHFAPKVKAYIIRLGINDSTAEELMQETLLTVWRKSHLYQPEKAAASTWIFTLARNQSIDWMRQQKYPEYSCEDWQELELETESQGEQLVMADRMRQALQQLPPSQAEVLYLSFFEGCSHADIAERLNIPLGSVKSRIRLASEKLRSIWKGGAA